jgi:hypothetical protein
MRGELSVFHQSRKIANVAAGGFPQALGPRFQASGRQCDKEFAPVDHVSWWGPNEQEPLPWKAAAPFTPAMIGGGILRE